jgi:hypothetical protein
MRNVINWMPGRHAYALFSWSVISMKHDCKTVFAKP